MRSRRLLLASLVGAALAGATMGNQLLYQPAEAFKEEKADMKEEKGANAKRWPYSEKNQPLRRSKQCNLTGWWKNELGSKMQMLNVDKEADFTGMYYTAVSSTQKPIKPLPLHGSQHLDEDDQCTFGFTVNWKNFSDSTAVFVGQCFVDNKKQEVLQTDWLLREKVDDLSDNWKATRTGRNIFTRVNPKEE